MHNIYFNNWNKEIIDVEQEYLAEVLNILRNFVPDCEVWAFGSRVDGTARKYSDLDLVVVGSVPLEPQIMEDLRDALAESDLPITVDVLDWHSLSESFREIIERNHEVIRL